MTLTYELEEGTGIAIVGPQLSGKSRRGDVLAEEREYLHVETGPLLKQAGNQQESMSKDVLGLMRFATKDHRLSRPEAKRRLLEIVQKGGLAATDVAIQLAREFVISKIGEPKETGNKILLNGLPRSREQVVGAINLLAEFNTSMIGIIEIQVSEKDIQERLKRRIEEEQREDDISAEVVKKRLEGYKTLTAEMTRILSTLGLPIVRIDGGGEDYDRMNDALLEGTSALEEEHKRKLNLGAAARMKA